MRLQFEEILVGLQVGITLRHGNQAPQRRAHLRLRLLELGEFPGREVVGRKVDRGGFSTGLGHGLESLRLVCGIALDRVHQVGNQVGTALVLRFDVRPRGLQPLLLIYKSVVRCVEEDHHDGDDSNPNPFLHNIVF